MTDTGAQAPASVCLKQRYVIPFSPSAFQSSLQTSIFRLRNRTNGAHMTIINRSDVKNHMRPPFLTKIHLCPPERPPESQPDATGFSEPEPDPMNAQSSGFAADFVAEHSSPTPSVAPGRHLPGSFHAEAPTVPKSAKA